MWLFKKKHTASDEELARAYFLSGDRRYLGELFEVHVKTVYGACLFYFRDRDAAKDMVMQVFEKLITELRKTEVKNFKAWLGFVVRNHCISELRKNKGRYFVPETWLDFEMKEGTLEEEEKIAGIREEQLLNHMHHCLPMLKEQQRICVELFYLQNYSYWQISVHTGFSENEVKSYIQNGKRNLKLLIEEKLKHGKHAA
jgi:RNA polymerase sigma factor (sigma-70 family)